MDAVHTPEASPTLLPTSEKPMAKEPSSRTRLSSGAKMFQPRPATTTTSTTFYATPQQPYRAACSPALSSLPTSIGITGPAPPWPAWGQQPYSSPLATAPPQPTLLISQRKPQVILGSDALPSLGSGGHATGECKPCVFFHKKGCASGKTCLFCHLCDEKQLRHQRGRRRGLA